MGVIEEGAAQELQPRLKRLFRELLKPLRVKSLEITKADRYSARGVVLTVCPIEKRVSGKDFEVGLGADPLGSIEHVTVDGKRLYPKRSHARKPRRARSKS